MTNTSLAFELDSSPDVWRQVLNLDSLEAQYHLPAGLMTAIVRNESAGDPQAENPRSGAAGLFQFMPNTARFYKIDPYAPEQAAPAAAQELGTLYRKYGGDLDKTLAGWNWGQGRVDRLGLAKAPRETRDFISTIKGWITPASAEAAPPVAAPRSLASELLDGAPAAAPRSLASELDTPPPAAGPSPAQPGAFPRNAADQPTMPYDPTLDNPANLELLKASAARVATYPRTGARPEVPYDLGDPAGEWARAGGALAVQGATTAAGGVMGSLAGPVTGVAGAAAGSLVGLRLNKALGLVPGAWNEPASAEDALAVGAPIVFEGLSRLGTKVSNAWQGRLARPEDQALVDLAKAHNMDNALTYSDVRGNADPTAGRRGTTLEAMSGSGAGKIRVRGQAQASAAAQTVGDRTRTQMQQLTHDALPEVQAAAQAGDREAGHILRVVQEAGTDPGGVIKASAGLQMMQSKLTADQLYTEVARLAAPLGTVPPTQTIQMARQALKEIEQATLNVDPTGAVKHQIERVVQRLAPTSTTTPGQAGFLGSPPVTSTTTPVSDYGMMRTLRSELGEIARSPAMRDSRGAAILGDLRGAVSEDMRTFALNSGKPDLLAAQQRADAFYPTVVNQRTLFRSIEQLQPDQVGNAVVKRGQGDLAQTWFDALDAKGQAAVRANILQTALTDGTAPAIQPTTGLFSPARLAKNLEDARAATGVFFPTSGEGKWELNGFIKLMRHVERVGQYAENPPTGQRTLPMMRLSRAATGAVAGGSVGGLPGAAVGLIAEPLTEAILGRATTALFMSPGGRNFLLAASDLTPGSRAMTTLVETLAQRLPEIQQLWHHAPNAPR